jgi:hypothetical protein
MSYGGIQIFVDMTEDLGNTGKFTLDVDLSDIIESIKADLVNKIYNNFNRTVNPVNLFLYFQGRLLEEARTLADYSIGKESWIKGYIRNDKYNKLADPKRFKNITKLPKIKDFYVQNPININIGTCSYLNYCDVCDGKAYHSCNSGYARLASPNCSICQKQ